MRHFARPLPGIGTICKQKLNYRQSTVMFLNPRQRPAFELKIMEEKKDVLIYLGAIVLAASLLTLGFNLLFQ
jgi:hypothetical protein